MAISTKTPWPSMTCVGSDQAWIQTDTKKIKLVDKDGTITETIHTDFGFDDMVLSQQGNILLTNTDRKSIMAISPDKTVKTLFPLQSTPRGMCYLHSQDIAVTFLNKGRVIIYNMSGMVVKKLDKELFVRPFRVAQSKVNNDLYISDLGAEKVLALDKDYRVLYKYSGKGDRGSFSPRGLCTDNDGHVLITDIGNNRVEILNSGGQFLKYLLTREQRLESPWSIDVDSKGDVWVGDSNGVKVFRI